MDNRPLELQAEKLIESKLIKYGLLVTKPSFDKEGTDLLIIKDISQKITPLIKVQCKGRTIKNGSNLTIPAKYVEENFIVFLYVEEERSKDDFLYVFFQDDIMEWRSEGTNCQLTIPKDFQHRKEFRERLFTREAITKIENILLKQVVKQLIKTNHSIIIDGIFLENVIKQTQSSYRKIYPEKTLHKPSIDSIVKECLEYTDIQRKEEVNCYLIYSSHFNLECFIDIGEITEDEIFRGEGLSSVGCGYNLFKLKTQDFVCFKVEEQLNRIVNVENILLIADDYSYVPYLHELQNRGIEVIVFQNSENSGSRMYHGFKWVNIVYPLALSMGLKSYEL
ncbi:hypothetical protein [Nostoc sp. UHCC 0251]|uniref:hypothetical protein n=1 Tax=Nostoc sp. UHCC 0251 TaxID=3110240 RepID=UPI002B212B37|nr:hypothetical protein [Nostoc sp. UHCC 0251]MEA5625065.1 hypothetical protein [Nostoc sp. UHCC 0251]